MKQAALAILILTITLSFFTTVSAQQKETDFGEREFKTNCAVCHGADAKGNGILVPNLKVAPPDLTLLAKKNGGVFPIKRMYDVIDGRAQIAVHGSRDMPIWGTRYSVTAAERYSGVPSYNQEAYIRTRIINLIDYLHRIQQK